MRQFIGLLLLVSAATIYFFLPAIQQARTNLETQVMQEERCIGTHQKIIDQNNPELLLSDCFGKDWSVYRSDGGLVKGIANGGDIKKLFSVAGPMSFGIQRPNALTAAKFIWQEGPPVTITYSFE